jgi:hypothetical protein
MWTAVWESKIVEEAVNPALRELLEHFEKSFWGKSQNFLSH